jgi:threonine dehydrogenase-like Zn-dependent dehydrogenase
MCEQRLAEAGVWIGINAIRDQRAGELYQGALAEYCVVPEYCCYPVPNSISDEQLAAVEGVAFSVRCIRGSGLRLGDDVVLFGAADYCIEWLQWAKKLGARRVAVVEPVAVRREMASRFGADLVVDPSASHPVAELRKLLPFGADLVAVYPTYPGALSHALEIARSRTTIQVLICYEGETLHQSVPLVPVMKELTLRYPGLFEAEPWRGGRARGDYALAIELLADRRIDVTSYVTRIIDWSDVERVVELGFDRLPEQEVKVRLRMRH